MKTRLRLAVSFFFSLFLSSALACDRNDTSEEPPNPEAKMVEQPVVLMEAPIPDPPEESKDDQARMDELREVTSRGDFATTETRLRNAIESKGLSLMTVVDHQKNASKADLALPPTKVFVFGNPKIGTPLMIAAPSLAIDLPQKILVTERDGTVTLRYVAPEVLARRHALEGHEDKLDKIDTVLAELAKTAAGEKELPAKNAKDK